MINIFNSPCSNKVLLLQVSRKETGWSTDLQSNKSRLREFSIRSTEILRNKFSNSFNFFYVLKDSFNKHGCNFDDVAKTATLGLLKINVF